MFRTIPTFCARLVVRNNGVRPLCSNPVSGCNKLHETLLTLKEEEQHRQPRCEIHEDSSQMLSANLFSNLAALKFNCDEVNSNRNPLNDFTARVKAEIKTKKPEMVILNDLQERHFLHVIKKFMKDLGYDSNFGKLRNGKGQATFIRHSVIEEKRAEQNLGYYRSRKPDPC